MQSRSKGQWFLISAVIVTGAFLSISLVLKDYFVIDASGQASGREDVYLWNIKDQFAQVVEQSSCDEMGNNLNSYITFVRNRMSESGYLVYIEYGNNPGNTKSYTYDCQEDNPQTQQNERVRNIDKAVVVASNNAVYYWNIDNVTISQKIIKGL